MDATQVMLEGKATLERAAKEAEINEAITGKASVRRLQGPPR